MRNENMKKGITQIDMKEIANGMYFYSLTSQNKNVAKGKLLVTH